MLVEREARLSTVAKVLEAAQDLQAAAVKLPGGS